MASVEIIPGEMRLWSDRDSAIRPPAGGAAARAVLASVLPAAPGRVLVVGPHGVDVLDALAGHDVTVLVRSLSDAEEIASGYPTTRVVCGDFAAFTGATWDLVVALDGVERVASNDFAAPTWRARVDGLAALVAEDGRLLVAVDNPAGALALADARPLAERRETGDWEPPAGCDKTRPVVASDAVRAFADSGLVGATYAAFWLVTRPGVLATSGVADLRLRAAIAPDWVELAAYELLFDPTGLALSRYASGHVEDAASGWLLALSRSAQPTLPAAVVVDGSDHVLVLDGSAPGPGGVLVSDRAIDLAQSEDLVGLRSLVSGYLGWVEKTAAWAAPDRTALDGDTFSALVDGAAADQAPDVVTAAAVWLARRLLAPDIRRIWPPWMQEFDVARTLAAMAGTELDPKAVNEAIAAPTVRLVPEDLRGLRALNAQLREELVSARGEIVAHERLAANRDRQLENRTARLAKAEIRAERANQRAAEAEVRFVKVNTRQLRRVARAVRHPRAAVRAIRARLKR